MTGGPAPLPASHGRLFVGPFLNAKSRPWLRRHGVTHIVNASEDAPCLFNDISYLRVAVRDAADADLASHFDRCHAFVRHALSRGGSVLIHCRMGRSRSPALLAAFLLREEGLTLALALEYVRSVRQIAAPNSGFLRQLKRYEGRLAAASSAAASAAAADDSLLASFDWMLGRAPRPIQLAFLPQEMVAAAVEEMGAESARAAGFEPPARALGASAAFALCEGRLAIDHTRHQQLWKEACSAWKRERTQSARHEPSLDGAAAPQRENYGRVDAPESDALRLPASRAVALLSGGQSYTAWNDRKRRLLQVVSGLGHGPDAAAGFDATAAGDAWGASACAAAALVGAELELTELALRSFPKAHEAWAHRRWLLRLHSRRQPGTEPAAATVAAGASFAVLPPPPPPSAADAELSHELRLSLFALQGRRANYHAARHAARAIAARESAAPAGAGPIGSALELASSNAALRSTGDASVLFVRRAMALAVDADAVGAPPGQAPARMDLSAPEPAHGASQASQVAAPVAGLGAEVAWARAQLATSPWQEALWAHLRALLLEAAGLGGPGVFWGGGGGQGDAARDEDEWAAGVLSGRAPLGNSAQMVVAGRLVENHQRWARRR